MTVIRRAWAELTDGVLSQLAVRWVDDQDEEHALFLENGEAIEVNDELSRMDTADQRSRRLSEIISERAY